MCACVCLYMWVYCPWRPEKGIGFPGAEVTSVCELLHVGSGTRTPVSAITANPLNLWPNPPAPLMSESHFLCAGDWHTQSKLFIIELHPQPSRLTFILKQGPFVVARLAMNSLSPKAALKWQSSFPSTCYFRWLTPHLTFKKFIFLIDYLFEGSDHGSLVEVRGELVGTSSLPPTIWVRGLAVSINHTGS